jgi:hypothetical protein
MKQKRQKIEDTVEDEVDPMKLFEQMD